MFSGGVWSPTWISQRNIGRCGEYKRGSPEVVKGMILQAVNGDVMSGQSSHKKNMRDGCHSPKPGYDNLGTPIFSNLIPFPEEI